MLTTMFRYVQRWLNSPITPLDALPICVPEWSDDMAEHHAAIWWKVKPHTKASVERVVALCQSIAYLEKHQVHGAIVECGVGKGGNAMAAALALLARESTQRQIYLFDPFAGNAEHASSDVHLAEVKQVMMQARYPWEKLSFVPGACHATLARHAPPQIALLMLGAFQYDAMYRQLKFLYPRLADGGILMVDRYVQSPGTTRAVDGFFREQGITPELRTIDAAGRLSIKRKAIAMPRLAA